MWNILNSNQLLTDNGETCLREAQYSVLTTQKFPVPHIYHIKLCFAMCGMLESVETLYHVRAINYNGIYSK